MPQNHTMTRRAVAALLAALGLEHALATVQLAEGKRHRRRRRKQKRRKTGCSSCGLCRKCRKGRCRPRRDGADCGDCATCRKGKCALTCPSGETCSGGICAPPPSCRGADVVCSAAAQCCSGICTDQDGNGVLSCGCAAPGQPCAATGDCCAGRCVGFVCGDG